jgi:proteasome accessory factor C
MSETAVKRALRTMDLIPYILENPGISLSVLAHKLSTTEKQIRSDLELIFMCGLPGYTPYELIDIVLEDDIVTVIDPQVLNKPRKFSKSEVVIITLGLKILSEIGTLDETMKDKVQTLLKKIANKTSLDSIGVPSEYSSSYYFKTIQQAIFHNKVLEIQYASVTKDELSFRKIQPLSIYLSNGNAYLSAIDLDKKAERTFRLDAIVSCELKEGEYSNSSVDSEKPKSVQIKVAKRNRLFIERNSSIIEEIDSEKEHYLVKMNINNYEWLARTVLSNAPDLEIVSPLELKRQVAQRTKETMALYGNLQN